MGEGRHLADSERPSSVAVVDKWANIPATGNVSSENGDNLVDTEADVEVNMNPPPKVNITGVLGLVGPSCDVLVQLEGKSCQDLLDTGSMVSTVTYSLSQQLKLPIHPMNHLIQFEGVEVVPHVGYNCTTPVLIGTNILKHLHNSNAMSYQYPWFSVFKCMNAQVRDVSVSAKTTKSYTIPAESGVYIDWMVHAPVFSGRMTVVTEESVSPLGGSVTVTPCVLYLSPGTSKVCREVKNFGKQAVKVPAKSVICNLQQTSVVPPDALKDIDTEVPLLDQFDWDDMCVRLNGLRIDVTKDLIQRYDIAF